MEKDGVSRRRLVLGGLGVAAGVAGLAAATRDGNGSELSNSREHKVETKSRMPVVFAPHGGGPWPFVDIGLPASEVESLADYLRSLREVPKRAPRALLVISAHWEEAVPTVMTNAKPALLFDYYGFPEASYRLTWDAPGAPDVAERVQQLLGAAGFESARDGERGFDHGTFIPLKVTYPEANIPTLQLSLKKGLDPSEHLAMGRALAPLRDEGVFIVGSGMSFHNLRAFRDPRAPAVGETFDAWLSETAQLDQSARDQRLVEWAGAPAARFAHPREEHLLPLMVVAGAAGNDRGVVAYSGPMFGVRISGYHFG